VKPKIIYISLDGPRVNSENDYNLIEECANLIASKVTWTDVKINRENTNLGCKEHVIKAISNFFNFNDQGIILEDDCIPSSDFFDFCNENLVRYKNDMRTIMVSGNNYGKNHLCDHFPYFFSKYISIWGWATWKNKWLDFLAFYKLISNYSEIELENLLKTMQTSLKSSQEGKHRFNKMKDSTFGDIDSWDYILSGYAIANNMLTIIPRKNLISNIGFGIDSTHTTNIDAAEANLETFNMSFPMLHPPYYYLNYEYEMSYQPDLRKNPKKFNLINRILNK